MIILSSLWKSSLKHVFCLQGAFVCDMILLYMMNTSSYYRERKFEIINFKYDSITLMLSTFSSNFDPSIDLLIHRFLSAVLYLTGEI